MRREKGNFDGIHRLIEGVVSQARSWGVAGTLSGEPSGSCSLFRIVRAGSALKAQVKVVGMDLIVEGIADEA
ncbi:MAG TPA: hypothetical protein VMV29_02400 [Ktedonobacterales bacterium]|nr:hypothetical protein [Ktedonobacterales bacterium]